MQLLISTNYFFNGLWCDKILNSLVYLISSPWLHSAYNGCNGCTVYHTQQKFLINFWVQSILTQNAKFWSFLIEWANNWLNTNTKDAQIQSKFSISFHAVKVGWNWVIIDWKSNQNFLLLLQRFNKFFCACTLGAIRSVIFRWW